MGLRPENSSIELLTKKLNKVLLAKPQCLVEDSRSIETK